MKFSTSELQIMELFWKSNKPLSSIDVVKLSPEDKPWRDNSIYIMIQALQKKGAIKEIGAVKGEKGKYLRLFEPTLSREQYYSKSLTCSLDSSNITTLFSALINEADLNADSIKELEDILKKKKQELN